MSDPIVYVDTSEIRQGALDDVKVALEELVAFVDANEPQAIAYSVYLNKDGTRMTVFQVHPHSASLEFHMEIAGPLFLKLVDLIKLTAIDIYGTPSAALLKRLQQKAQTLGDGTVTVHELHAGFTRFADVRVSPE